MSKDITVIRDVLCGHAQGLSLKKIQEVTGVPKTSVKRIIDQAHATELSIEALLHQPDEAIIELMMPSRRACMNYIEPDWEGCSSTTRGHATRRGFRSARNSTGSVQNPLAG